MSRHKKLSTPRRAAAGMGALALAVAAAAPAFAAADRFTVAGEGTATQITLPGLGAITGGASTARVQDTPNAEASALGLSILGDAGVASAIAGSGEIVADPVEGHGCATAPLEAITGLIPGLTLGAACAVAVADATTATPRATSRGSVGVVGVDGSIVADFLVGELLTPVTDAVDPLLEQVQGEVLAPVIAELTAACNTFLEPAVDAIPPIPEIPGLGDILPISDLVAALPIDNACVILTGVLADPPLVGELANLTALLADAFDGVELLSIELGSTTSDVTTAAGVVTSIASAKGLAVNGPSLDFLLPILDGVVADTLQPFLDDLATLIDPVTGLTPLPATNDLVAQIRGLLDLPILTLDEPIISVIAASSLATARLDRATGIVTTTGDPASLSIALSSAFADLLGEDNTSLTVAAGQTQTLFAGTPIESTFSVGDATTFDATEGEQAGEGVRVAGVDVALLTGIEGGIGVAVGSAEAFARAAAVTQSAPGSTPQLPTTGGGAVLFGMLATTGAALLRRRD